MVILQANNLKKSYGQDLVFEKANFFLQEGEVVALLGRNGTGKSTLLKMIKGLEHPDAGTIQFYKKVNVGYMEQMPDYEGYTVQQVLMSTFKDVSELEIKMRELEESLGTSLSESEMNKVLEAYGKVQELFDKLDGYSISSRVDKVKNGMNIDEVLASSLFNNCSGGEKTRIMLAKTLLEEPEVLLLDEPTNNLDIETMNWLEQYVKDYKGSIIIVSHDRYFLDKTIDRVLELDTDGIEEYTGNYTIYIQEKEQRFLEKQKAYEKNQYTTKRMEMQIRRLKNTNAQILIGVAKQIEGRLEKMEKVDKPIYDSKSMRMNEFSGSRAGSTLVYIDGLSKSFENKKLFDDFETTIDKGDRIGIIGENGSGKTTLLNMLVGREEIDAGTVRLSPTAQIGYLDQNPEFEDESLTILEEFMSKFNGMSQGDARNKLASMLFTNEDVYKKLSVLSGGEKIRLKLSILMNSDLNLLILDEPTNHLDLNSREVLEENLQSYDGTLVFVSHDRYFLEKMTNKIWNLEGQEVSVFKGDYLEFMSKKKVMNQDEENPKIRVLKK